MLTLKADESSSIVKKHKKQRKPYNFWTTRVSQTEFVYRVDWTRFKPKRGGVIVHTLHEGKTLFGLGLDRRYKEITDFGGGVKYSKDQNAVIGALREFMEESLYVFGPISPENVRDAMVTYTPQLAIILVNIQVDPRAASILFRERACTLDLPEVSDIVWLTSEEFMHTIRTGKTYGGVPMYEKVREILRNSIISRQPTGRFSNISSL